MRAATARVDSLHALPRFAAQTRRPALTTPETARDARRQARLACAEHGVADDRCDDVVLVLSELVGNALRHGSPPVNYTVAPDGPDVLVTVEDGDPSLHGPASAGSGTLSACGPATDAESGRGLQIVATLSRVWGWRPTPAGKLVWARL